MRLKCTECLINGMAEAALEGNELVMYPYMASSKTLEVVAVYQGESLCGLHLGDRLLPMYDDFKRTASQAVKGRRRARA